jgi:diaminopimelate epimerase
MNFTKMHGAGNDFVVIKTSDTKRDWSKLAIAVLDRHLGIGADSVLLVLPSSKAQFYMRTFDADGSEAETCGNGIRCVARYVLEKGLIDAESKAVAIETLTRIIEVKLERKAGKVVKFRANMGKPGLTAEQIPLVIKPEAGTVVNINSMLSYNVKVNGMTLKLNCVSMGNPHAVHFMEEPVSEFPMAKIGPLVENLPIFPNRVNFEVARVLSKHQLEARVWERGVGETLACGSGSCAITVASKLAGHTENDVQIKLPGGTLDVEWNKSGDVILGGPAEIVFEGIWPE